MLRGLHSDRTDIHSGSLKDATETSKNLPRWNLWVRQGGIKGAWHTKATRPYMPGSVWKLNQGVPPFTGGWTQGTTQKERPPNPRNTEVDSTLGCEEEGSEQLRVNFPLNPARSLLFPSLSLPLVPLLSPLSLPHFSSLYFKFYLLLLYWHYCYY